MYVSTYLNYHYQDVLEKSDEVVKRTLNDNNGEKITAEEYVRQKRTWEAELERVRFQLHESQMVINWNF